jgi:hypothetical protein
MLAKSVSELIDKVEKPNLDFKKISYALENLYFGSDELINTANSYKLKNDLEREFIFRLRFV